MTQLAGIMVLIIELVYVIAAMTVDFTSPQLFQMKYLMVLGLPQSFSCGFGPLYFLLSGFIIRK